MIEDRQQIRKFSTRLILLIIVGIIVLITSFLNAYYTEYWAMHRDTVACVPVNKENNFPHAYIQSVAHPLNSEAKLQSFIKKYVKLTKTKQIVDFHKVINDPEGKGRFDKARLSDSLLKAINMSDGIERDLNKMRYAKSTDEFFILDRDKMGLIFLIDEILTFPVPATMDRIVVVRGQYDQVFDQAELKNKKMPIKFMGYKELRYIVRQDFQLFGKKTNEYDNKYGLYVINSSERNISPSEYIRLRKRSRTNFIKTLGDEYDKKRD